MNVSPDQKHIYNQHLASYKRRQDKPYKYKVKFDDFFETKPEVYACLAKLELFFRNHPAVNRKLFFSAPYEIYQDRDFFDICYYTSQSAIKSYSLFLKQLSEQSPDSPSQLVFINDSLLFIKEHCIKYNISLIDYFKSTDGVTPAWVVHFAEHDTSIYAIIGFMYFNIPIKDLMMSMPYDEIQFFFSDVLTNFTTYKTRLDESLKAKVLLTKGIQIIDKCITDEKTKKTS